MAAFSLLKCCKGFEASQGLTVDIFPQLQPPTLQCGGYRQGKSSGTFTQLRMGCVLGQSEETSQLSEGFQSMLFT